MAINSDCLPAGTMSIPPTLDGLDRQTNDGGKTWVAIKPQRASGLSLEARNLLDRLTVLLARGG